MFGKPTFVALALGAFLGVISHLLADILNPMGIAPWWPISAKEYTTNTCRASDPEMNHTLLAIGLGSIALVAVLSLWATLP